MRILLLGSGGREHALFWKLSQNPAHTIWVAPGNAGCPDDARVPLSVTDAASIAEIIRYAVDNAIDLVVPGPELPLCLGIADACMAARTKNGAPLLCFGPVAACARLEGSKSFAKEVMLAANVPTAQSRVFHNATTARAYIMEQQTPLVLKADGLAAGKGVVVAHSKEEALEGLEALSSLLSKEAPLLIEEFLEGEEVSLLCFCDGENVLPLPSAQDHKQIFDDDKGPNTGGMGAYSPAPILPDSQLEEMANLTVLPIVREMAKRGTPYKGILYAGLMLTATGPKVLEYNVRFGDPECQPLMMRLQSDLAELMLACVNTCLSPNQMHIRPETALGVVLAAKGYPGSYPKGMEITGIEQAEQVAPEGNLKVFHSGTTKDASHIYANGGRVLCITALESSIAKAQESAYQALALIHMPHSYARTDIGAKAITRR